jgi:hypothetical protein
MEPGQVSEGPPPAASRASTKRPHAMTSGWRSDRRTWESVQEAELLAIQVVDGDRIGGGVVGLPGRLNPFRGSRHGVVVHVGHDRGARRADQLVTLDAALLPEFIPCLQDGKTKVPIRLDGGLRAGSFSAVTSRREEKVLARRLSDALPG